MQLFKIGHDHVDVVECVRTLRMARDLRNLPRGQLRVDILGQRLTFFGEFFDLGRNIDGRIVLHVAQFLDLGFQLGDRLLEIQKVRFLCGHSSARRLCKGQ